MSSADHVGIVRTDLPAIHQDAITTGRTRYRNQDWFRRTVREEYPTYLAVNGHAVTVEYPSALAPWAYRYLGCLNEVIGYLFGIKSRPACTTGPKGPHPLPYPGNIGFNGSGVKPTPFSTLNT